MNISIPAKCPCGMPPRPSHPPPPPYPPKQHRIITLPIIKNTLPETYNSIVSNHVHQAQQVINKIDRCITISESENAIALESYKNDDIVLINKIDITKPINGQLDDTVIANVPICPQIDILPLLKCKDRICKKQSKNRLIKVATFLNKTLFTTS